MTLDDPRYAPIASLWASMIRPPLTRHEAARAARRIYRRFGARTLGGPAMSTAARFDGRVRRCWITTRQNAPSSKGWERLVHDVSHRLFALRHPHFRAHDGGHATLEREIAQFVVVQGWLNGTLCKPAAPPTTKAQRHAQDLARVQARIERWNSKMRRAHNALNKLKRRQRALQRALHPPALTSP
jgi:hypothetical protein